MTFSSLIGNEFAKLFLTAAAQNNSLQVFLFSGPEGVGKRSFAQAFAEMIIHSKGRKEHPDLRWFCPEGKSHQHTALSLKGLLESVNIAPFESAKKVYVLEEAERMLPSNSNALLKTLEEPPSHAIFILITSHEEEVLPTILSRCIKVPFYPISEELLVQFLEKKKISTDRARQIAVASQGSLSKALNQVEEKENPISLLFLEILKAFFPLKPSIGSLEAFDKFDKLLEKKDDTVTSKVLEACFEDLLFWLRDLHLLKIHPDSKDIFHHSYLSDLMRQAQGPIPSLEKVSLLIEEARFALQRHFKAKVILDRLFYQMASSLAWA